MKQISAITGREYKPFTYYGDPDAENVIVAMGSVNETIKETIDYMRSKGEKAGLVTVHLYRPFSPKYLFDVLPASVKRICVLDRTKEPGANGEPLYLDVQSALQQAGRKDIVVVGGRYGLASKDTTPGQIVAVYDNLERAVATEGDEDSPHKKGLEMIFHQYQEILKKLGVTEIEAQGQPFDPEKHNAVMHIDDENLAENTVAEVFRKGYQMGDRVVRFAMVKVAN